MNKKNGDNQNNEKSHFFEIPKSYKKFCRTNPVHESKNDGEVNKINDDCLGRIFQYLTYPEKVGIERVCKKWKRVSQSSWKNFTIFDSNFLHKTMEKKFGDYSSALVCNAFFGVLTKGGPFVKEVILNLTDFEKCDWRYILTFFNAYCKNIEKFILYYVNNNNIVVICYDMDLILKKIFKNNKKLKFLEINNIVINGECLLSLPFKSLESIDLKLQANYLFPKYFKKALKKFKKLKSFSFKSYQLLHNAILTDILESISLKNNKINYLCLVGDLNKLNLSPYFAKMKNLKTIMLEKIDITKGDLLSLPLNSIENFQCLNKFSEGDLTHQALWFCVSKFVNLIKLEIDCCNAFGDDFCEILIKCNKLKSVKLHNCRKMSNDGILKISSLPELERLYVSYVGNITDVVLPHLLNLKSLEICNVSRITRNGLCDFINNVNQLEFMTIDNFALGYTETDIKNAMMNNNNIPKIKIIFNGFEICK